jgi:TonB family protein
VKLDTALFVCLAGLTAAFGQEDSVSVPKVVGLDVYNAARTLARAGLEPKFQQADIDTAVVPEYCVAGQTPDSGSVVPQGTPVTLRFNSTMRLQYWDDWAVPLLADYKHTVGFFRATKPPEPIAVPEAGYPPELLKFKFNGSAQVEVLVDFDGAALAARLLESSGHPEADSSALSAALRGTFSAAENNGEPVRVWLSLPFAWKYEDLTGLPSLEDTKGPPEP